MLNENVSIRGIFMTQNTNPFSKLLADIFLKDTSSLHNRTNQEFLLLQLLSPFALL